MLLDHAQHYVVAFRYQGWKDAHGDMVQHFSSFIIDGFPA